MSTKQKKTPAQDVGVIEERWTKPLIDVGWTALPNIVLLKQAALGLKPMHINIIMQIAKHWWEPEKAPYPSVGALAEAIGVKEQTVRRNIKYLVEAGFLEKTKRFYEKGGQKSNSYTFDGLIERCRPFAEEMLAERARNNATEAAITRRKEPLPKLHRVK